MRFRKSGQTAWETMEHVKKLGKKYPEIEKESWLLFRYCWIARGVIDKLKKGLDDPSRNKEHLLEMIKAEEGRVDRRRDECLRRINEIIKQKEEQESGTWKIY
jgi:hypothetical protein